MSNRAMQAHQQSWEDLIKKAANSTTARYGIYTAGTMAVKHPEIYLQADNVFYEGALNTKGFKEAYEMMVSLGWCFMELGGKYQRGEPQGEPFSFDLVPLDKYRLTDTHRIYMGPFLPFIDLRMAPLAMTLKTEGMVVSPLELAKMYYFKMKTLGRDTKKLFLVWCDNEEAYLADNGTLLSVRQNLKETNLTGKPVLVFNENSVWYPLMGRDDTNNALALKETVTALADHNNLPTMSGREKMMAEKLAEVTALETEEQKALARLAANRGVGWAFHPYAREWLKIVPADDLDIIISRRLGIIREFVKAANTVSPATAYLFGIMSKGKTEEEQFRLLEYEYLRFTGVVREKEARGWKPEWRLESWGHVWPCGLMEHTIDDGFRARTGHCVSQSFMFGAVLDMAKVPYVVVNFNRGGINEATSHHFVITKDGRILVDDGIVNIRGKDPETEDYGPLLSFSVDGEWASTVRGCLYGNIDADRTYELVQVIDKALNNRFELRFFGDNQHKIILSKEDFLNHLKDDGVETINIP